MLKDISRKQPAPLRAWALEAENKGKGRASLTDQAREVAGTGIFTCPAVQGVHCASAPG